MGDKEMGGLTATSVTGLANNPTMKMASQKLSGREICSAYANALGVEEKNIKYKPVMGPCLMSLGIMPDFGAMHRYWRDSGYPIEASDEKAFRELVPQPWTIDDYFKSLGNTVPQKK